MARRFRGAFLSRSFLARLPLAQLCQRLHVPTAYFRRCPAFLQDAQVNHWLFEDETKREQPERWLLRAKADTLRGIGEAYRLMGEPQKALEYFSQALSIQRAVGDQVSETATAYATARAPRPGPIR